MPTILTDRDTPRLRYVADLLFRRFAGVDCVVTTDPDLWSRSPPPRILYTSRASAAKDAYHIRPSGLLSEEGIPVGEVPVGQSAGAPVLFPCESGDHPFDVFSAAFHLVARCEEYGPHRKDAYGRYDHRQSLAYRLGFLQRPVVEAWARDLLTSVFSRAGLAAPPVRPFTFSTSCDVDIAYSYRHKGVARGIGSALRSLAFGRFDRLLRQVRVSRGSEPDPYDAYDWLEECHRGASVPCRHFILLASEYGAYDRNLPPSSPAMQAVVRRLSTSGEVGLHPSWRSGERPALLASEKALLERLCGRSVTHSRQHYLRFSLPDTYRLLISLGITDDHSMGYGTVNGYRASVSFPHPWYDLERESETGLTVHPFCFMDATAHHEEGLKPEEGLEELRRYLLSAKSTGGALSTVWHNGMLGTEPMYGGWREVYVRFLSEVRDALCEQGEGSVY